MTKLNPYYSDNSNQFPISQHGWETLQTVLETKVITSEYFVSNSEPLAPNEIYQEIILDKLLSKLKPYIVVNREMSYSSFVPTSIYKAKICVADIHSNYVNYDGTIFKVNGEEFTNEELIESVRNTFPDRFI